MPSLTQPSFGGGEISPGLYGRVDLARYQTALRRCENWIILRSGGATNRPGFQFIGAVRDATETTRLIPFQFDETQTYILEFCGTKMRVIKDGALVTTAPDTPFELATAFTSAQLPTLQYAQSGDVLRIPNGPGIGAGIYDINRLADDNWTTNLLDITPTIAAPANVGAAPYDASSPTKAFDYVVTAVNAKGQESEASDPSTIVGNLQTDKPASVTWDAVTGAVSYNIYRSRGASAFFGYIGSSTFTAFEDDNIVPVYTQTPPVWSDPWLDPDSGLSDGPSVITYYQQRLIVANNEAHPETVWASRSAQYGNFGASDPPQDDDALEFSLAANQVQQIRHLLPLRRLVVLTSGGVWVAPGGPDGVLTPSTLGLEPQSSDGASRLMPLVIGNTALYVQSLGSVIRDLLFSQDEDSLTGNDLSVIADHLFQGHTITAWAYQRIPHSIVWAVRDDGVLLGLTYMREQQVIAWHQHTTAGRFLDVAVVTEGAEDAVYCVIERTVDGATVQYIERMASRTVARVEEGFFVDSGLSFDGFGGEGADLILTGDLTVPGSAFTVMADAAVFASVAIGDSLVVRDSDGVWYWLTVTTVDGDDQVTVVCAKALPATLTTVVNADWAIGRTTFSGMDHLEGETLSVLGDGSVREPVVVSGGSFTLQDPAVQVHAGLPYTADLETLDLTIPGQTVRDRQKLVGRVTLLVHETRGLQVGQSRATMEEAPIAEPEFYDDPLALYSGDLEVRTDQSWNKGGRLIVQQPNPLPATLLSVIPEVTVGG